MIRTLWAMIRTHLWRFGIGALIMIPLIVGTIVLAGIAIAVGRALEWAFYNPLPAVAILIVISCYTVGLEVTRR